jgi:hypothetical protein
MQMLFLNPLAMSKQLAVRQFRWANPGHNLGDPQFRKDHPEISLVPDTPMDRAFVVGRPQRLERVGAAPLDLRMGGSVATMQATALMAPHFLHPPPSPIRAAFAGDAAAPPVAIPICPAPEPPSPALLWASPDVPPVEDDPEGAPHYNNERCACDLFIHTNGMSV